MEKKLLKRSSQSINIFSENALKMLIQFVFVSFIPINLIKVF